MHIINITQAVLIIFFDYCSSRLNNVFSFFLLREFELITMTIICRVRIYICNGLNSCTKMTLQKGLITTIQPLLQQFYLYCNNNNCVGLKVLCNMPKLLQCPFRPFQNNFPISQISNLFQINLFSYS